MSSVDRSSEIATAEQRQKASKPPLSTHILDTTRGMPASGISVRLLKSVNETWLHIKESTTEETGRCADLADAETFQAGRYKLQFEVGKYFNDLKIKSLYPIIEITFDVTDAKEHYHIPLLLNPFGYTTYRGS